MKEIRATVWPFSLHENCPYVNNNPGKNDLNLIAPSEFHFLYTV